MRPFDVAVSSSNSQKCGTPLVNAEQLFLSCRHKRGMETYVGSFPQAGVQLVGRRGGQDVLHHADSQAAALRARGHDGAHAHLAATVETLAGSTGHHDWLRHGVIWP